MGASLVGKGDFAESRTHVDLGIALYDPAQHRPLAMRFGLDARVSILFFRSWAQWSLGYPEAALADARHALNDAREVGQAATLMYALGPTAFTHILRGNYAAANAQLDELAALADEKGSLFWKAFQMATQGCLFSELGRASDAIQMINSGITAFRSTGATVFVPLWLLYLTRAYD